MDVAEALGAEFYCFECEREFYADHDATYCPYCGEENEFHGRNTLLGLTVEQKPQREDGDNSE